MSKLWLLVNVFCRSSFNLPTPRNRKPRPGDSTPIAAVPSETLIHIFEFVHNPENSYSSSPLRSFARVLSDDIVVPVHFKAVPGGPDAVHRIYNGKRWKRDPVLLWAEYAEVCGRGTTAFAPPLRTKVRAIDFYRDIDYHTDQMLLDRHSPEFRWCAGVRHLTLIRPLCQVRLVEAPGLRHLETLTIDGIAMAGSTGLDTIPSAFPPRLTTLRLHGDITAFLRPFLELYGAVQKIEVLEILVDFNSLAGDLGTYASLVAPLLPTLRRFSLGLASFVRCRGFAHLLKTLNVPSSLSFHYSGNVGTVMDPIWIFDEPEVLATVDSFAIVRNMAVQKDICFSHRQFFLSLERILAGPRFPNLATVDLDFRRCEVERDGEAIVAVCAGRGIELRCWEDLR